MTLETFKTVYLIGSILGTAVAFWLLRKEKENLLTLSTMTFLFAIILFPLYLDAKRGYDIGPLMEDLFHAFIAVQPDLILTICNLLLWGTVPFAGGIWLLKKKSGKRHVWVFFGVLTLLKTLFDDQFIIHLYSKMLTHPFEWGYVLFDWGIIYALAGVFLTKGREYLFRVK